MNETIATHRVRHVYAPGDQTINGIYIHCNISLNENKSIPQGVFAKNK